MEGVKMQLRQGSVLLLQQRPNEPIGRSIQFVKLLRRSKSSDAKTSKSTTASDPARLRLQLRFRFRCSCSYTGPIPSENENVSSHTDSAELAGTFQDFVKSSRHDKSRTSSSHMICRVLSSAVEAHNLSQRPIDGSRNHGHSDHEQPQNDEAEGEFQVPVGKLRAHLCLWEVGNETRYYELLAVADYLERLGLDVYFRQEIKSILDRVFRIWTENDLSERGALLGELQCVALAFYLLRSQGYDVQPSILELYRKGDGSFAKAPLQAGRDGSAPNAPSADLVDVLNLLRASDLRFGGDAVLQDAHKFASTTLNALLKGPEEPSLSEKTSAEIRYRLQCPWALNLRMLETRQTILNFQVENVTSKFSRLSSTVVSLMLFTATRLVNHYNSVFQREIEDLDRWSRDSGLSGENKFRDDQMILRTCYLGLGYEMPQAKYAHTREVHSKACYILTMMDDLFDVGASMEDLVLFNEAWRKWNPSLLEKLPKDQGPMSLRIIYGELYNLTKSWARQSSIWHGRDLLDTFILTWALRMEVYLAERRWVETGYKFTRQEYMNEIAKWSFGVETAIPLDYYSLPGGKVSDSFGETRPDMEAIFGTSKTGRFLSDARSYQHEKFNGCTMKRQLIEVLMEENPVLTEDQAIEQAEQYAQSSLHETTESILRCDWPNHELKRIMLSHFHSWTLVFSFVDGLQSKDWTIGQLMDPIPYLRSENW